MNDTTTQTAPAPQATGRRGAQARGLTPRVEIKDLDFYYGDTRALKGCSLPLYQNQTTAFIGPSGCGKSTLLRVLNRMYDLYPNQRALGPLSQPMPVGLRSPAPAAHCF